MAYKNYPNVTILDNPLLKHKITKLRDKCDWQFDPMQYDGIHGVAYRTLSDYSVRAGKVERPCENDVEPVCVAELVSEQFHAGLGGRIGREWVRQVAFFVQTS